MNHKSESSEQAGAGQMFDGSAEALQASPFIPLIPLFRPVSGLYEWKQTINLPQPIPIPPLIPIPLPDPFTPGGASTSQATNNAAANNISMLLLTLRREELRLDVDGNYPQNTASGAFYGPVKPIMQWVASIHNTGPNTWAGNIWYKNGNTAGFPYTNIEIKVVRGSLPFTGPVSATITYSGGGSANFVRTLGYKSPYFHVVNFEYDFAAGTAPVTNVQTHAHPNRPATLPNETLTIETVYRRAGFNVSTSPGGSVPLGLSGTGSRWSIQEMHDAMQTYWSRFQNAPQWAAWVFFAGLNEEYGTSLGGIMFDDIGTQHRQGTAIFENSFIATPPAGDANPAAWVQRMRFWTAVHEIGHTFNLAHSWDKAEPVSWIPLATDPTALSFMNYPYKPAVGGQATFFSKFMYRFSDSELLFMRHAPESFVEQGGAEWFDHHGFQRDDVSLEPKFRLDLIAPRAGGTFEFLEPVVLDLKLTNISDEPQLVDEKVLADSEHMIVVIKKQGKPAREYVPFTRKLHQERARALAPGQSVIDSLFIGAGRNGWDISEPGNYTVQIKLNLENEDIISAPLNLRVERPRSYDEENLARDFFTDDVGRVLAFDGSRVLTRACDTLRETTEMLKGRRVAIHARVALGSTLAKSTKQLDLREIEAGEFTSAAQAGAKIHTTAANEREARETLEVLVKQPNEADQTLGRTDFTYYVNKFQALLGLGTPEKAGDEEPTMPAALVERMRGVGLQHNEGKHAGKATAGKGK